MTPSPFSRRHRRSETGYNLVEVMIAMGLLSSVLISIVALFVMGRRNVYSGKEMTAAVSMATRVAEDLAGLSVPEIYTAFGITDSSGAVVSGITMATVTVDPAGSIKGGLPQNSYAGSIVRRTSDTLVTAANGNDAGGYLTRWKNEMDNNLRFAQGAVNIVITPRNPETGSLTITNATVVRIRVLVRWQEELRPRQLIIDTVKTRRPIPS